MRIYGKFPWLTATQTMLLCMYIMINIKTLITVLFATVLLTACSVKNPALNLGKKCLVKEDQVVYSYVWLFDSEQGLKATKEQCNEMAE